MSSTIPMRAGAPPTAPLPALPIVRSRKPLPDVPPPGSDNADASNVSRPPPPPTSPSKSPPQSSAPGTARPHTRSFTASGLPTPTYTKTHSTPAVPTLTTTGIATPARPSSPSPSSAIPTPGKTLRKTASIGQFPLPPKANPRISSLPPSPLSAATSTADVQDSAIGERTPRDAKRHQSSDTSMRKPKTRSSGYGLRSRTSNASLYGVGSTPSLLNGTAESNLVASADAARKISDAHLSLPSPIASGRSSVNGSYHTDGTSFEEDEQDNVVRGRRKSHGESADARAASTKDGKDGKGNVLVSVRVRPDAAGGDDGKEAEGEWLVDGRRSLISYRGREGGEYRYDNVFSPHDHNARVYDHAAKRLVRRVMEGYHGTVFAYGMTGTGKTFSMQGTATSPGVIPLAISDIFSYIRENPSREFLLRVSYLEIYNEEIYDLLMQSTPGQPQQEKEKIQLREDPKRGVYATPLKEEIVQSPNQLLRVIARGDLARRTGSTQFNARSSRSHAVVQIVVESRERTSPITSDKEGKADRALPGGVLVSTLSLIDLAGSEKAADSKERRTEGAHINQSLLTLGTVISKLSGEDDKDSKDDGKGGDGKDKDKKKSLKHLPYRQSKLTRLLQPALAGNSLVSILCTIQLSSAGTSAATTGQHTGETLNTLKFASRAKNNIVSHAKRNESNPNGGDAGSRALLDRYRIEIQELRTQLEKQTKAKEDAEQLEETERDRKVEEELERQERLRHEEQMLEMQLARTALKERISHLNRLILSSKSLGVNSNSRRLSSASTPLNRISITTEFGRPVSVRSMADESRNGRESTVPSETTRQSVDVTAGSSSTGIMPPARVSQLVEDEHALADEDDDDGEPGLVGIEGEASLTQQNRMLQADLADKNRYIATLEKRLLQARRTSHSRTSMQFAGRGSMHEDNSMERLLQEKDREIDELRAKLDDQMRMVNALRSASRKRDMQIDQASRRRSYASESHVSDDTTRPNTAVPIDSKSTTPTVTSPLSPIRNDASARSSMRSSKRLTNGSTHRSTTSSTSRSSAIGAISTTRSGRTTTPTPLSPIALLSPAGSDRSDDVLREDASLAGAMAASSRFSNASTSAPATQRSHRRRSVDEMTQLLDQMIQDKVDSGHVVRGSHGSLRVKRDTVIETLAAGVPQVSPPPPPSSNSNPPPSATRKGYEGVSGGMEFETLPEVEEMKG